MSRKKSPLRRPQGFEDLANDWLLEIEISDVTRRAYRMELDRFNRWARMSGATPSTIDAEMVGKFGRCVSSSNPRELQALGISRPLLASSLGQARRIVGAWLRWAAAQGRVTSSLATPVAWPRVDRKPAPSASVTARQLNRVVRPLLENKRIGLLKARERFVAGLAFWLCLNPTEIAALCRQHIRVRNDELAIRVTDSESMGEWGLAPSAVLRAWLTYDAARGRSRYAVTGVRTGNPVSTVTVARIIRRIKLPRTAEKGPRQLSARALKRSFVRHAVQCGWSTDDLQRHLRRQTVRNAKIPRDGREQWQQKLAALDAGLS